VLTFIPYYPIVEIVVYDVNNASMPFQLGNTLWKEGAVARQAKEDELKIFLASGGARKFKALLDLLADGKKIKAEQHAFMKYYAPMYEYVAPKLARIEGEVDVKHSLVELDTAVDRLKLGTDKKVIDVEVVDGEGEEKGGEGVGREE